MVIVVGGNGSSDKENIKVATNIPGLKDKIQINVSGDMSNIFWYIRFNIPLDESTVSQKTMSVTDTDGYIMRTDISYDDSKNMIVISPLDTYEQGIFYILHISKKVKSARGQKLQSQMYILFKIKDSKISEFRTLKKNVVVPSVKKRPSNYEQIIREKTVSKVYSSENQMDSMVVDNIGRDSFKIDNIKINMWIGIIGIIIIISFAFTRITAVLIGGLAVSVGGMLHIISQLSSGRMRSIILYNRGVRKFNKEQYHKAAEYFRRAVSLNDQNELAEYANSKITFYL